MGIEKAFNKTLAGQNGYKDAQYDVYGYKLPGKRQKEKAVKMGTIFTQRLILEFKRCLKVK